MPCLLSEDATSDSCITPTTQSATNFKKYAVQAGVILGVKYFTEILCRPISGVFIDSFGYKNPLLLGAVLDALSTLLFAFAKPFPLLVLARVVQGIGSSISGVAALTMLTITYDNEVERSKATATAFGGYAVGMLGGYVLGSSTYQPLGRRAPFLFLTGFKVFDGVFRMLVVWSQKAGSKGDQLEFEDTSVSLKAYLKIVGDPYILHGLGTAFVDVLAYAPILTIAPPWLYQVRAAQEWQIGIVFLISGIAQLLMNETVSLLLNYIDKWVFACLGLLFYSISYTAYPWATTVWEAIGPNSLLCAGFALSLSVITPIMVELVKMRHCSEFGTIIGLQTSAQSLGFAIGASCSGAAMTASSFEWSCYLWALISFLGSEMCVCMLFHAVPSTTQVQKRPDNQSYELFLRSENDSQEDE
ncbi:chromaffin granule amine transporter isoform X2 [Lingula anatina]|nr:chromaffin granule amine transporter isoform X2 [Lingula anatina]|eukprot:XP_013397170.1 chromaffin granule amine transporter isoform X2 [Lingula anatina]